MDTVTHLMVMRVGSDGSSSKIKIKDFDVKNLTQYALSPSFTTVVTGAVPNVTVSTITNADKGTVLGWEADAPAYCASSVNGTCQMMKPSASTFGFASTVGNSLAFSGTTAAGVVPVLQAQDGTFYGYNSGAGGYQNMIHFDLQGNIIWSVPNDYPQIATADGGVVGYSGVTYDNTGRANGQTGGLPTYSWKGAYTDGPVQSIVSTIRSLANTFGAVPLGNLAGNGTAIQHPTIGLFWCGVNSKFSGPCAPFTDLGMNYFSSLQPYPGVDFTGRYPNWVDVVQTNALGALKAAFSKFPVLVESASTHPERIVFVTGYFDRSQHPQSGHTQEGTNISYLNYGNILVEGVVHPPKLDTWGRV